MTMSALDDDDTPSTRSNKSESSLASLFHFRRGRKKKRKGKHASTNDPGEALSLLHDNATTVEASTEDIASKENGRVFDLERIIGLCVVKLQVPSETNRDDKNEAMHIAESHHHHTQVVAGTFKKSKKLMSAGFSTVPNQATLLIPKGNTKDEPRTTKPCCHGVSSICSYPFRFFWRFAVFRIALVPALLCGFWSLVCMCLAKFSIVKNLLLPYLALGLSIVAIMLQSWIVARPIAIGLATLISQLQDILDLAFFEMLDTVPRQISLVLQRLHIPRAATDNLCSSLFLPFRQVLTGTIYKLIPRLDDSMVPSAQPLAILVFVGLLLGLVMGQILVLLTIGSSVNGSVEIGLGLLICVLLGWLALYAHRIVVLVLSLVEIVMNLVIQFLLRKLLPVAKLQKTSEYIERLVPKGKRKRKRTSNPTESAPVQIVETV